MRRSDERGVENGFILDLAGHVLGLVDDAIDGRAIHASRLLAEQLEDLLQAHHVVLCLAQMRLETALELRVGCFVDHLRQRLHDLLFRVVDVAQRVREQVVHCLDVFRKEAHRCLLSFRLSCCGGCEGAFH